MCKFRYYAIFLQGNKKMFTGLIREIAQASLKNSNLLEISAVYKPNIGDSIA